MGCHTIRPTVTHLLSPTLIKNNIEVIANYDFRNTCNLNITPPYIRVKKNFCIFTKYFSMGLDTRETPKNKDFHEKTEALISVLSDFISSVDMLCL